jgi:serine/threonine protein kinase
MKQILQPAKQTLPSKSAVLNKNDFKLLANLGEGSFGKVYKVEHTPTDKLYAIKVMDKEKIKHPNMVKQVRNEIDIMQVIDHPNIVQLTTYFENESKVYLVLELGGVDLADFSLICTLDCTKKRNFLRRRPLR